MILVALGFLLFAGILWLNTIGLTVSVMVAAIITGVVFLFLGFTVGERVNINKS
jgi:hypothetical protein